MRQNKHYGYIPDLPDHRDFPFKLKAPRLEPLPAVVDLSGKCPPVYNQGALGSCTANASAAAYEFLLLKDSSRLDYIPSRLFTYYQARAAIHTEKSDSGAMIRDAIKSLVTDGACHEALWPYSVGRFAAQPPLRCFSDAAEHKVALYERLRQNLVEFKTCLANGIPFVFGFSVYQNFESIDVAHSGVVGMPSGRMLGGHAVLAVGYNDNAGTFLVRNSWGAAWGQSGYFTIPYGYLGDENLAADFWAVQAI